MKCDICEIGCSIPEGFQGLCGQYINQLGEIREVHSDRYLVVCPISIETMPMLHYYPGGKFLQISTTGCNFDCPGCISNVIVKEMNPDSAALCYLSAEQVVGKAVENQCLGIAFLMNDPLASFQSFLRVAIAAKEHNLLVGCSTNGYFTEASLQKIMPYLDFVNMGFKGFNNEAYRRCGAPSVQPVLRNIKQFAEKKVHVEVSCMFNKYGRDEVIKLAQKLSEISEGIPFQIMRYIPLEQADPELEPSIREAEKLWQELKGILEHVYLFNSPGTEGLNSYCPSCGKIIYRRDFYGPMGAKLRNMPEKMHEGGNCSYCGKDLSLYGAFRRDLYQEGPFQGGYPFTRALEMVEAMLVAMGVKDKEKVVKVWENILVNNKLENLERDIQRLPSYLDTLIYCGKIADCRKEAQQLTSYIETRLQLIQKSLVKAERRPRAYYAMGKPRFAIKGERIENQLIEAAGGHSVNRDIEIKGRPGMSISVEQLNTLNPEVIFISGFISSSVADFNSFCREERVNVSAVRNGRIYVHPAPGWDFGSPRWILGLMYISSVLHPDLCQFDITAEAREFYQRFYGQDFKTDAINRSFGKPNIYWQWGKV